MLSFCMFHSSLKTQNSFMMQLHCCLEQRGIEFVKTTGHFDSKENRIQNHKHVWGVVTICIGYFFMLVMLWSKPILCPSLYIGSLSTSACLPMGRDLTISSTMAARQKPQTGFSTVCRMYHYYLTPKKDLVIPSIYHQFGGPFGTLIVMLPHGHRAPQFGGLLMDNSSGRSPGFQPIQSLWYFLSTGYVNFAVRFW